MNIPNNRLWPYCDEFEFFKYKKVLHAKNVLSIRNISNDLYPFYEMGRMMRLFYFPELRPSALKKYAACCYWDGQKINIAFFIKNVQAEKEKVVLMKTYPQKTFFSLNERHLLCRFSDVKLSFWQRFKLRSYVMYEEMRNCTG